MQIAKLSTGKVVRLLRVAEVPFASGVCALVCPQLRTVQAWSNDPYWVPITQVVWVLKFMCDLEGEQIWTKLSN